MKPEPPEDNSRLDAIATRWSLIREAHTAGRPEDANTARQALVLRYAKAIRRYVGGIVKSPADADELAQDAVLRLMKGDFAGADPNRGRFRDLLKTAVRNMVRNHWAKENRRRPADFDMGTLAADAPDPTWDSVWQSAVLELAWSALKEHERSNPRSASYTVLKLRTEFPDVESTELAQKLSAKIGAPVRPDACRQMLRRARLRFANALVVEAGAGLADPSPLRVAEELAALGLLDYVRDFLPEDWNTTGNLTPE